jgi:5-methylcytosine-specific restriction endonuclease McrA
VSKGLRKNERCPIHSRFDCCGREASKQMPRRHPIKGPVTRIPDEHAARGYREIRSPGEMRKLVHRKVKEQQGKCAECGKDFQDIREAVPDHIEPKGMGGQWRDDHPSNIRATCVPCNNEKGSKRIF